MTIIKASTNLPIPAIRMLRKIGQGIKDVRRHRHTTIDLMAERGALLQTTIQIINKDDPTTSMGGYASALFIPGMEDYLSDLVNSAHELIGPRLEDKNSNHFKIGEKRCSNYV